MLQIDTNDSNNNHKMYKNKKISLAKAAEMLKIDLWHAIDTIKKEKMYLDYSEEELKEDL